LDGFFSYQASLGAQAIVVASVANSPRTIEAATGRMSMDSLFANF